MFCRGERPCPRGASLGQETPCSPCFDSDSVISLFRLSDAICVSPGPSSRTVHSGVFNFRTPIQVRFRDLDSLKHVNNAVYLTYLEFARIGYWKALKFEPVRPSMLLARVEIDYLKPVLFDDQVEVAVRVSEFGSKSFVMVFEILANTTVAAKGSSVQVWFDHAANSSVIIPDSARVIIQKFEGGTVVQRVKPV
jgi:acyl-CoA thioester hydrolase